MVGRGPDVELLQLTLSEASSERKSSWSVGRASARCTSGGNLAVLREHLHEVRLAQPGRGLDRAELHALRSARPSEVAPELREVLRRERLEGGELRRHDSHERVDASHAEERELRFLLLERVDQSVELVEDLLEPQLARLMHDDEEQLVRVLGRRARALQREQLVEREIRPVGDLVVRGASLKTSRPRATRRRRRASSPS